MKPLIDVRPSPMPKSWKDSIRAARAKEVPETAVQLIAAAAARGAIPADGWTLPAAQAAHEILKGLARSESRCSRIRGLIARLTPKPEKLPKVKIPKLWHLVGSHFTDMSVVQTVGKRRSRASGTQADMLLLLHGVRVRWADLPGGVEVESLLQQSADEREAGQRRARLSCCGLKEWRERSDA